MAVVWQSYIEDGMTVYYGDYNEYHFVIEQDDDHSFELYIDDRSENLFSSVAQAKDYIQTQIDEGYYDTDT